MANLTTYIARGYDLTGGATTWTSVDLSDYSTFFLDFIWSNVTGTLDGSLLIRQTNNEQTYDSIETFTIDTADETRLKNNVNLTKNKLDIKFTPNGITGGRLSIKLKAIENNLQQHNTDTTAHNSLVSRDGSRALTNDWNAGNFKITAQTLAMVTAIIDKANTSGIKIDKDSPGFGWRDILGDVFARNTGASKPSFTTYRDTLLDYQFAANDEEYLKFHIPHDYVAGTDIFLHFHWSHTGNLVTGGSITFEYEISYSKGHNQTVFPASVSGTIAGDASTAQYQQIITEVQISAASPSGSQIDSDELEPDGVILMRVAVNSNDITVSGGGVPDPFIHYVDIHYQSTNISTKDKVPNFYN